MQLLRSPYCVLGTLQYTALTSPWPRGSYSQVKRQHTSEQTNEQNHFSAVKEINQGVELGSNCALRFPQPASPSLLPRDWDLSALASRQAAKEGGSGGETNVCVWGTDSQGQELLPSLAPPHMHPPQAPAAPGVPTVANRLNYFLISTG